MFGEVVIEAGSESIAESPHLWIEAAVFCLRQTRNLERVVAAILLEALFAIQFSSPAQSKDEILFDAPKIILGLGIGKTENCARVGSAKNVRHVISVTINSHRPGKPVRVKGS